MPLIIPKELPAFAALENENVFVMHKARAVSQDIRPLRILLVNLMPTKIATETQIARVLANSPLQVQLTLLRMGSHESTHVSGAHLEAFYKTFEEIRSERFDGMIITGAPVEQMAYEDVDYWPELCAVMDYSRTHVYSTMHICWGAQAALYYHYGIPKYPVRGRGLLARAVRRDGLQPHPCIQHHAHLLGRAGGFVLSLWHSQISGGKKGVRGVPPPGHPAPEPAGAGL